MLTNNALKKLLIGGSMLFLIVFILFWAYFYNTGAQIAPESLQGDQIEDAFLQEQVIQTPLHTTTSIDAAPVIASDTKITLQMLDESGTVIAEETIRNEALLGMTQTMVEQAFKDYTLKQFDEKEVCLQKRLQRFTASTTYALVIRDASLGILEKGEKEVFVSLQLPTSTFTARECALFEGEGLSITAKQKLQLEEQPYYIEQILQNYSE